MINSRTLFPGKNADVDRFKNWQAIMDHDAMKNAIQAANNIPPIAKDLISLDEHRMEKSAEQALLFPLQADSYYSVLTIHIDKGQPALRTEDELCKTMAKIGHLINIASRVQEWTHHIFNKGSNVNILFMWNDIQSYTCQVRPIAELIDRLLVNKAGGVDYRIGIGRAHQGIEQIWQCLQDGEKSVNVARTYTNERIVEFEKLGIYRIFSQDHLNEELLRFYNSTLKVLVEYDRKSNSELVKSLKVFFSVNGNLKKMSEILFAHYNTILYRISRIQEITGTDLKSENDRYDLQTALRIMNILELEPASKT